MIGWIGVYDFSKVILSLILHGSSSTSISLLWNGSKADTLTLVRGLRQGDPLSHISLCFAWKGQGR